jgi:hypothetical protein
MLYDANLVIPTAKLCSAGHIINDSQLIEKGKDLATINPGYSELSTAIA